MTHSKRVPTFVLAAGVLALAATDWLVVNSMANGDKDAVVLEAAAPAKLPNKAFLTGKKMVNQTVVDGVLKRIARTGTLGYALTLHNPTDTAITVRCDVQSWVTEGSRRGRMVPRAQLTKTEPLQVQVAAGQTLTRELAFADPAPKADAKKRKGWFRTVSFQVREPAPEMIEAADGKTKAPQGDLIGTMRLAKEAPKTVSKVQLEAKLEVSAK
jgi:hypothetical protein